MSEIPRRHVLRGGVACLGALWAGCLDGSTGRGTDRETGRSSTTHRTTRSTTPERTPGPNTGWLEIHNSIDTTVSVSITVAEAESGETVFDRDLSLDPSGHAGFEDVFPEYGRYEVALTVAESRSKRRTVRYEPNGWTGRSIIVRESEIQMQGVVP